MFSACSFTRMKKYKVAQNYLDELDNGARQSHQLNSFMRKASQISENTTGRQPSIQLNFMHPYEFIWLCMQACWIGEKVVRMHHCMSKLNSPSLKTTLSNLESLWKLKCGNLHLVHLGEAQQGAGWNQVPRIDKPNLEGWVQLKLEVNLFVYFRQLLSYSASGSWLWIAQLKIPYPYSREFKSWKKLK